MAHPEENLDDDDDVAVNATESSRSRPSRRASSVGNVWTQEDGDELAGYIKEFGRDFHAIGRAMDRSYDKCYDRAHELGLLIVGGFNYDTKSSQLQRDGDDESNSEGDETFAVGDKVGGQWNKDNLYYPGVISRVNWRGGEIVSYNISYDDGEKENGVVSKLISSLDSLGGKEEEKRISDDEGDSSDSDVPPPQPLPLPNRASPQFSEGCKDGEDVWVGLLENYAPKVGENQKSEKKRGRPRGYYKKKEKSSSMRGTYEEESKGSYRYGV